MFGWTQEKEKKDSIKKGLRKRWKKYKNIKKSSKLHFDKVQKHSCIKKIEERKRKNIFRLWVVWGPKMCFVWRGLDLKFCYPKPYSGRWNGRQKQCFLLKTRFFFCVVPSGFQSSGIGIQPHLSKKSFVCLTLTLMG